MALLRFAKKHRLKLSLLGTVLVLCILFPPIVPKSGSVKNGLKWADWTGFGEEWSHTRTTETTDDSGKVTDIQTTEELQPGISFWDLISTLLIPVSLAVLGFLLQSFQERRNEEQKQIEERRNNAQRKIEEERNRAQEKVEKEIANNTLREEALQDYLDRMSTLLIDHNLSNLQRESDMREIALDVVRARTLSILRLLDSDGDRKGSVIRFLIDTDLTGKLELNLSDANLSDANLRGASLVNARLVGADLRSARLQKANLDNANLARANLENADLKEVTLSETDLSYANLKHADFTDSKLLIRERQTSIDPELEDIQKRFQQETDPQKKARLRNIYTNLSRRALSGQVKSARSLAQGVTRTTILLEAQLQEAKIENANWEGINLNNANLHHVSLKGSDLNSSNLSGANLSKANLTEVKFKNANLTKVNFEQANLTDAEFIGADLTAANLSGANLTGADFKNATITNANFSNTNHTQAKNLVIQGK